MVNATYQLSFSGKIHFVFTVTFQHFGAVFQDFGVSSFTKRALSFDHPCSVPQ